MVGPVIAEKAVGYVHLYIFTVPILAPIQASAVLGGVARKSAVAHVEVETSDVSGGAAPTGRGGS